MSGALGKICATILACLVGLSLLLDDNQSQDVLSFHEKHDLMLCVMHFNCQNTQQVAWVMLFVDILECRWVKPIDMIQGLYTLLQKKTWILFVVSLLSNI